MQYSNKNGSEEIPKIYQRRGWKLRNLAVRCEIISNACMLGNSHVQLRGKARPTYSTVRQFMMLIWLDSISPGHRAVPTFTCVAGNYRVWSSKDNVTKVLGKYTERGKRKWTYVVRLRKRWYCDFALVTSHICSWDLFLMLPNSMVHTRVKYVPLFV